MSDLGAHTMYWGGLWYRALEARWGICVRVTDVKTIKNLLYQARQKLADPSLLSITINTSPRDPRGEVWLVKQQPARSQSNGAA